MTSGVRLSASESLLTLPADSPAYLVSDEQGQCQLWPWGCFPSDAPQQSAGRLDAVPAAPLFPSQACSRHRPTCPAPAGITCLPLWDTGGIFSILKQKKGVREQ